ncbi:MAG: GntP family permease [Pirellulales bacterium]|nr:GntP family permease [Pirellulales bacterium]
MVGIFGILVSLALLMYLAYRGVSVIVLAPLLASLAVLVDGDAPLLASYTQVFMAAMGKFTVKYFPIFLLGAIFGKLMEDSGSARAIALWITRKLGPKHAILAIVLACAVLTYGGVSLFVVAFAVYPLAAAVFREADVPKRLIPGAIALGSFTLTMTCLPGTVQIQNLIPMPYFKTTAFAAPALGMIGGLLMLAAGMAWLNRRARRAARAGEGYGTGHVNESAAPEGGLPSLAAACLPIVAVIALNYVFAEQVIPRWDASYLTEAKFGSTSLSEVQGIWSILAALLVAIGLVAALNYRSLSAMNDAVGKGAAGSLVPIFNTASVVGYGATIASLAAFAAVKSWVLGISPGNPLVSEAVAISILAGITGSASGGLSIALEALGGTYYQLAIDTGISPELMHRVAAMASGGLDTLPHNGAVITLLTICGLTHRQSYKDIAVVSVIVPIAATAVVLAIGTALSSF